MLESGIGFDFNAFKFTDERMCALLMTVFHEDDHDNHHHHHRRRRSLIIIIIIIIYLSFLHRLTSSVYYHNVLTKAYFI